MRPLPSPLAVLASAVALAACGGAAPALRGGAASDAHSAEAAPPSQTPASRTNTATAVPAGQAGAPVVDEEAAALEAAKQHPIAHPGPRPLYPEQAPPPRPGRGLPDQAPPPRDRGLPDQAPPPLTQPQAPAPEPQPQARDEEEPAAEYDAPEVVVAPQQPPAQVYAETPPAPPAPDYVWAPGYWYWYGGRYVWVGGGWVAPRPGHVWVSARWVYSSDGWVFTPGGWAVGFGGPVVYPVYPSYYHPLYRSHHHRYWHEPRRWDEPRRSVVRPGRSYEAPRRHSNLRPAQTVHPSSGGTQHVVPAPSRAIKRDGDRVRVYPKRR